MSSLTANNREVSFLGSGNASNAFSKFLYSKTVGDVIEQKKPVHNKLIELSLDSTMEEAFDLLLANDISSIPVYYKNNDNEKRYIAIVSALDLLKLLGAKVSLETLECKNDALLMQLSEAIHYTEYLNIFESSRSLMELLELFKSTHRVLVVHKNEMILVSQVDLIHFFQANNHHIGPRLLDLSVYQIKSSPINRKLNYKCTAASAFLALAGEKTVSALPIIDDSGSLITEISAEDVRGLNRERWDSLLKPVVMYLKSSHGNISAPFTCHDQFTLSQIMASFTLKNTHRVWWVDSRTDELKGVISLTDILSTFASYCLN